MSTTPTDVATLGAPTVTYEWSITVRKWNSHGTQIVQRAPATIFAANKAEVTEKMRAAFGAKYDTFRKFWSHDWTLDKVAEVSR